MIASLLLAAALFATNAPARTATAPVPVASAAAEAEAMPPKMVSVWNQALRESRRTGDLLSRGAIDAAEAVRRRAAIRRAFARVCRAKGLPEEDIVRWQVKIPR